PRSELSLAITTARSLDSSRHSLSTSRYVSFLPRKTARNLPICVPLQAPSRSVLAGEGPPRKLVSSDLGHLSLSFAVSGRDQRGLDGDRKTPGDRPAPEGPQRSEGQQRGRASCVARSRAQASAEHGAEEGRPSAVAGSRSGCAAAGRGARFASKKGRIGRTEGQPWKGMTGAHIGGSP
ncbi:MAG: hypothetical protein QOF70_3312, partial [Acetobacteraceae bacterium]|nr:hypothetical protein [Acetobacteraceae bacterium]